MPTEVIRKQIGDFLNQSVSVSEKDLKNLARTLMENGEDGILFLLLQCSKRIQELEKGHPSSITPSTPSGMIPPYQKASAQTKKKKKKKKAGAQKGHPGSRRSKPDKIDHQEDHRLDRCPDCGGPLQRCDGEQSTRSRIIEDIPEDIQPIVTEHIIHRDYCPACQKHVEPKIDTALRKSTIVNRLLCLTAFWHYALGMTTAQILDTLNYHLHFQLSKGGLIQKWHQLRMILLVWYEALAAEVQQSAVLHADETG